MMTERLAAFVLGLEKIDAEDTETLKDAFMNEVIENGGVYASPSNPVSGSFRINLHGIMSSDWSEMRAIRNWRITATVALVNAGNEAVEDDGFITVHPPCGTPRNHAGEIRNTQAAAANRNSHAPLFPSKPLTQSPMTATPRPPKK